MGPDKARTQSVTITELPSPNFDARPGGISMLILHYTGMQSAEAAIARLRDPAAKVSSHYVIDEDSSVFRLVAEEHRAYHAGLSYWRGQRALNDVSIGIEIVNPGHEWGYRPYPAAQMRAVTNLCQQILRRHPIPARNVVGHSDVAPTRKQDPGELFDWAGLAAEGIGIWPSEDAPPCESAAAALQEIGYESAEPASITAFQRHFLPHNLSGLFDGETLRRIEAVRRLFS